MKLNHLIYKEEEVLLYASLASQHDSKNTIDIAILSKTIEKSIETEGYKISKFEPFNPVSKRTEALIKIIIDLKYPKVQHKSYYHSQKIMSQRR